MQTPAIAADPSGDGAAVLAAADPAGLPPKPGRPDAKSAPTASRALWPGLALAMAGSIAFSGKAIIVKLAYRYGVDAVTLIAVPHAVRAAAVRRCWPGGPGAAGAR